MTSSDMPPEGPEKTPTTPSLATVLYHAVVDLSVAFMFFMVSVSFLKLALTVWAERSDSYATLWGFLVLVFLAFGIVGLLLRSTRLNFVAVAAALLTVGLLTVFNGLA